MSESLPNQEYTKLARAYADNMAHLTLTDKAHIRGLCEIVEMLQDRNSELEGVQPSALKEKLRSAEEYMARLETENAALRERQITADHPLIRFLLGEDEYEGRWFGDCEDRGRYKARYWWRSHLRALLKIAPPAAIAGRGVMRVLHLTLKRQWFDMIRSGQKREEYREMKPYWDKRLNRPYDAIQFRNGYAADAPIMLVELKELLLGLGIREWGAPAEQNVYILKLGAILSCANCGRMEPRTPGEVRDEQANDDCL